MRWNVELPQAEWYERDDPGLSQLVQNVEAVPILAIDTETTGLTVWKDMPLFWSLSFGQRRICMPADTLTCFKKAFADPNKTWVFANAKYDLHILANYGINIAGKIADTQVMHSLIYEEQSHALKDMALQLLKWKWLDFGDTFSFGKGGKLNIQSSKEEVAQGGRFEDVQKAIMWCFFNDRTKLVEYAANDAFGTMTLYDLLKAELEKNPAYSLYNSQFQLPTRPGRLSLKIDNQWDYFEQVEMPFTRVLFVVERNGISVDTDYLKSLELELQMEIDQIERRANQLAGTKFNLNSAPQLREYLIQKEGLRALKRTKGGTKGVKLESIDKDFLEYHENNEMAGLALRYRKLTKLVGTYISALPTHMDLFGRIHTRFNQDVARTGRLSSSGPNMQNIPNAERDVYKIRKAFIAPNGMIIICFDYDQLEMRLLGAASLEPSMIATFQSGRDIHMSNAELIYNIPYDDIKRAKKMSKDDLRKLESTDPKEADYVKHCIWARGAVKTVGFGQPVRQAEVKLPQNGELFAARAA
jgi:DNA polymerase-1